MSNSKVHKFFTLAKFRNVTNWSVSHILGMNVGFNEKYPMVMIGDIITRSAETVNIEDDKDYRQVTLKTNGGGAVQRKDGIKKGKEIGTKKQYVVHTGQFIMSKIDARNGAFGVIGSDLEGSIVTADFPVFDVDKNKVLPEYLKLISSTSRFVEFAKSCSSGTTNRQRIDVKQFLLQQIPLPSLDVRELDQGCNRYQDILNAVIRIASVPVKFDDIKGSAKGYFSPDNEEIVIQSGMGELQTLKTLVHELCHSILHNKERMKEAKKSKQTMEVEAESCAFVILKSLDEGMDTSEYSFGYVASWSSDKDAKELMASLNTIRDTSRKILELIENELDTKEATA